MDSTTLSFVFMTSLVIHAVAAQCTISEKNTFLKWNCGEQAPGQAFTVHKCVTSDELYYYATSMLLVPDGFVNKLCQNDAYFYQVCGNIDFEKSRFDNPAGLCGYVLCKSTSGAVYSLQRAPGAVVKQNNETTTSCEAEEIEEVKPGPPTTQADQLNPETLCNSICDQYWCVDEAYCNGLQYGIECYHGYHVPAIAVCDRIMNCFFAMNTSTISGNWSRGDERICISDGVQVHDSCERTYTGDVVPLFNFTRCGPYKMSVQKAFGLAVHVRGHALGMCGEYICIPYCKNYMDQTNCTSEKRVAIRCKIRGYPSNVSEAIVCDPDVNLEAGLCDDEIDKQCIPTSLSCTVHKHLLCNGQSDCSDRSDENNKICSQLTAAKCDRKYIFPTPLNIPLFWVGDGVEDCLNGMDENRYNWQICGSDRLERFVLHSSNCTDVFICEHDDEGFIRSDNLCDGYENCGNEKKICEKTLRQPSVFDKMLVGSNSELITSFCLNGLESLRRFTHQCKRIYSDPVEIFGVTPTVIHLPGKKHDCRYLFGELYYYFSCTGYCIDSQCPSLHQTPMRHDSCPGQFLQRIHTLANNSYLTFAMRKGNRYVNDHFICKNGYCIPRTDVCNLNDDCGDGSDEMTCSNNFKCNSTDQFLPLNRRCDGTIDCFDLSDECNEQCGKDILPSPALKAAAWIMGSMATLMNAYVLVLSIFSLSSYKRFSQLVNRSIIFLVSIADFLNGIYLIQIAIVDFVLYRSSYCTNQIAWLKSSWCSMLGVLSTIGAQLSLLSITALSIHRALTVRRGSLAHSKVTEWTDIAKLLLLIGLLVSCAILIATIPLIDQFEDYFVNGIVYVKEMRLFIGIVNKDTHFMALQEYYGRMKKWTLKWKQIDMMVYHMFSHDYNLAGTYKENVHFYGNDGVCLFKYFLRQNDPQKVFVSVILAINVSCFILISASYVLIASLTVKRSRVLVKGPGLARKQIKERNTKMQQKIVLIIVTDFICWVPFVIICILHFFEVIDATFTYSIFSIVVLPINSVINPFLYDSALGHGLSQITKFILFVKRKRIRVEKGSMAGEMVPAEAQDDMGDVIVLSAQIPVDQTAN